MKKRKKIPQFNLILVRLRIIKLLQIIQEYREKKLQDTKKCIYYHGMKRNVILLIFVHILLVFGYGETLRVRQ